MTERNKWLGGALLSLIVAQLVVGIILTERAAVRPSEFSSSFPSARRLRATPSATASRDRPGLVQTLHFRFLETWGYHFR